VTWVGKPFPEIYRAAAELARIENPRDVLCVGDSVEHDIAGANRFGAFAALVRTGILAGLSDKEVAAEIGRHEALPDYVITYAPYSYLYSKVLFSPSSQTIPLFTHRVS